jgi:hypothetical protein
MNLAYQLKCLQYEHGNESVRACNEQVYLLQENMSNEALSSMRVGRSVVDGIRVAVGRGFRHLVLPTSYNNDLVNYLGKMQLPDIVPSFQRINHPQFSSPVFFRESFATFSNIPGSAALCATGGALTALAMDTITPGDQSAALSAGVIVDAVNGMAVGAFSTAFKLAIYWHGMEDLTYIERTFSYLRNEDYL